MVLRSSIIYGPQSPAPVSRALFLQFVARQLAEGTPTTFFNDEFRSPVYVGDIVRVVLRLLEQHAEPLASNSSRWAFPAAHVLLIDSLHEQIVQIAKQHFAYRSLQISICTCITSQS